MFTALTRIIFGTEEQRKIRRHNRCLQMAKIIEAESVSCNKCNILAVPICQTDNKYRCLSCARQFAGARHEITKKLKASGWTGIAILELYGEAEEALRNHHVKK
jgi:hypothetical protein